VLSCEQSIKNTVETPIGAARSPQPALPHSYGAPAK
jgi:hypothetical protein